LPTRQPSTNGTLQASTHRHRLSPERLVQCARAVIAGEVPSPQPHARRLTGQQTARPSCARPTARRPHLTRDRHFPGSSPAGTASPKPLKAPSPRPSPRRHPRLPGRHHELTGNARSSIPPGRPGRARGLRPTQNGTIGAPRAGQYDQPLSVQIGGSVRVLHGLRGHSACCRPPSSIDVDWAWLRCGRKTEALDCAVLHCPTWVSATRAQTRLSHQSAQSRRKAGHWCPAGQDRVPSGRYEPRRSRGAIWRRAPATGSSRRAAAPRAAAWPRRPRRTSDRGYPQRSIRTSSPVSSSRHSCHWSS
jgi:hypothetical protein